MRAIYIKRLEQNIIQEWDEYIGNHPHGNVFQSPYMYKNYSECQTYDPILILVLDETDKLVGVLLSVVQNFAGVFSKLLASRAIIIGGPLVTDDRDDILRIILDKYENIIKSRALYTEVRNLFHPGYLKLAFNEKDYEYEEHLNMLIDLSKSEDELWREMHSKRRNEIRRAYKEGTTVGEAINERQINECFKILKEVYNRAKLPLPPTGLFAQARKNSKENCGIKVFTALFEDQIIGTMFILYWKNVLYDWYAGSYRDYYNKYPNDILPWESFLWGQKKGFKSFDFGGAGKPGIPYGVRDYKKQFGGKFVNYGRFKKVHQPNKMKIAEIGFKIWQKLQS